VLVAAAAVMAFPAPAPPLDAIWTASSTLMQHTLVSEQLLASLREGTADRPPKLKQPETAKLVRSAWPTNTFGHFCSTRAARWSGRVG
jgi:hypothetical protein